MPSKFTTLIEKAMGSSSDAEKLACLQQAKRVYRNEGVVIPPSKDDAEIKALKSELKGYEDLNKTLVLKNLTLRKELRTVKQKHINDQLAASNKQMEETVQVTDRLMKQLYIAWAAAAVGFTLVILVTFI